MSLYRNFIQTNLKNLFLDFIFPKFCFGCGLEGLWLCPQCQEKIVLVKTQTCPVCGRLSQNGQFCQKDQKPHGLSGIIVACYYDEGPVKELVHNFKYNHILELKNVLSEMMADALKENLYCENLYLDKSYLITAVPLHFLRKAQRGYNQAELLAEVVAGKLKIELNCKIIKKIHRTKPQVLTDGEKRTKNLENCFKISSKINLRGRTIILVDDVATTSTTLNECARLLKEAGAKRIWGLVIARG